MKVSSINYCQTINKNNKQVGFKGINSTWDPRITKRSLYNALLLTSNTIPSIGWLKRASEYKLPDYVDYFYERTRTLFKQYQRDPHYDMHVALSDNPDYITGGQLVLRVSPVANRKEEVIFVVNELGLFCDRAQNILPIDNIFSILRRR